jgi:hypothetical protein
MKFLKENLTVIAAIATSVSVLGAVLLAVNQTTLYSIIVLIICLLTPIAAAFRSRLDADREQSLLLTLLTDNLLPNKEKKYLGVKANIAIIGDESCKEMFNCFRADLRQVDDDLNVSEFIFSEAADEARQRGDLADVLSGSDAVILVKTSTLDGAGWIYEAVDKWAFQNSNVPIVVIDKTEAVKKQFTKQGDQLSTIPEKFYFVPDHRPSLSWRLLKRANGRSLSWRNQATFNRSVTLAMLILVLTLLAAGYLHDYLQKREMYVSMQAAYKRVAEHTKADYRAFLQKLINDQQTSQEQKVLMQKVVDDASMNLSYWVSFNGTFYPLATTDPRSSYTHWHKDEKSIVGCVLRKPNRLVLWDATMERPTVTAYNGEKSQEDDPYCGYGSQGKRKLYSMACASWSYVPADADRTVGVCLFTEAPANVAEAPANIAHVNKVPTRFLYDLSRDFYEATSPFTENRRFSPH